MFNAWLNPDSSACTSSSVSLPEEGSPSSERLPCAKTCAKRAWISAFMRWRLTCSCVAIFCASKLVCTAWLRISLCCKEKFPSNKITRIGISVATAKVITRRRNMGILLKALNIPWYPFVLHYEFSLKVRRGEGRSGDIPHPARGCRPWTPLLFLYQGGKGYTNFAVASLGG